MYDKSTPLSRDMSIFGLQQGNHWLNVVRIFLIACVEQFDEKFEKIIIDYLSLLP